MGCVQGKSSTYSPHQPIEKLKLDGEYVKGSSGGVPINHKQIGKVQAGKELTRLLQSADFGVKDRKLEGSDSAGGEAAERERSGGSGNVSKRIAPKKKIGEDELVDGWPKWLVDNVPENLLGGLVPKSADSYDKLAKVISVDIDIDIYMILFFY